MNTKITGTLRYYPPGLRSPIGEIAHELYGTLISTRGDFAAVAKALHGHQIVTGITHAKAKAASDVATKLTMAGIDCKFAAGCREPELTGVATG